MKRLRDVLEIAALLAFIVFMLTLCYYMIHGAKKLTGIATDLDRTVIIVAGAATNVEKASRAWELTSKLQALEATSVLTATKNSLVSMQTDVHSVAASANSLILLTSKAIDHQDQSLLESQADLQANLKAMLLATQTLQSTLSDVDKQVTSPDIQKTLDGVAASADNLAATTDQAVKTITAVRSGVEYEVAQIEKPVTKIKAIYLFILSSIGRFLGY
jgi:hypothetical protein